jgi:hypothetical protein
MISLYYACVQFSWKSQSQFDNSCVTGHGEGVAKKRLFTPSMLIGERLARCGELYSGNSESTNR